MADFGNSSYNRNPSGKNQYPPCAAIDDPSLVEALDKYHREKLDNNKLISQRLKAEYGIQMGASTVKRRRRALGFLGSRAQMKIIDTATAKRLVIARMDSETSKLHCARTIQEKIAYEESIHLPRDFIIKVMHSNLDQKDSEIPEPPSKPIRRIAQQQAQPPSTENDEPSVPNCSNTKELSNADTTCKEVVGAKEPAECEGERREGCPLQGKSGST